MSIVASDGFYTPAPDDVPRHSRWPWVIVAARAAVIVVGGVVCSGGAADSPQDRTGFDHNTEGVRRSLIERARTAERGGVTRLATFYTWP